MPLPRVAPPVIFPQATRASKPPADPPGQADAYRQTTFVLGEEVDLVLAGLRLESAVAEGSAGARFRNQTTAGVLAYWSRSWLLRLQALHSVEWGNYGSALILAGAAVETTAGALTMQGNGAAQWRAWLESGGVEFEVDSRSTVYAAAEFSFDEARRGHPELVAMAHLASKLSAPTPAATMLLAGPDSDAERTLVTFGDRDFHVALAELVLGWLLELSGLHLAQSGSEGNLAPAPAGEEQWRRSMTAIVRRRDRCAASAHDVDGAQRFLLSNWRRLPAHQPRKVRI